MAKDFMKNPQLDGNTFHLAGNKTGVLLLHGFTGTTTEVRFLAEYLHQAGFSISAPLLPGHGTTPDDLNQTHWQEWLETTRNSYLKLRLECTQVFVGGESMGALLSLLLASEYHELAGLMLFSPALKVRKLALARVFQYFSRYYPKNQEEDGLPWKGYDVYPVRGMIELLKLQAVTQAAFEKVSQPVEVFLGDRDTTILPRAVVAMMKRLGSAEKKLIEMHNSPHVMLLAEEKEAICGQVLAFMGAHIICKQGS